MKKNFFSILLLFVFQKYSSAQTDTAFWFAAPDIEIVNHPLYGAYDRPIYLRLTSFTSAASVAISIPANPAFVPITINIPASSTSTVDLTPWIDLIENSDPANVGNKGIYIKSTNDITAYYEVNSTTCNCNPEFFSLKGRNAIGNEFYVPSQLTWSVDTIRHPNAKAGFDIVATQNNTTVTVTPAKALIGHPANVPFTITLNRGQSYACIALYRNGPSMLNGSKVVSDKPVAVTAYEDLLFSDGACADLAGDQLIPTSIFGTEFAVVRGNLTTRDKVIITATQNNTSIYLNGNAAPVTTINAGQSYEYDLTPPAPTLYIKTDKTAGVFHYTGTGCEVGAAVIPKLTCTGSSSVSLVRTSNGGNASVMLVTKSGNQGNFLVNGAAGVITAADFSPIAGTAGAYVYAKKDVTASMPLNTATTFSNTTGKFQLGFFNVTASNGGCMYGFFSDFKKSNVSSSQLETCLLDSVQLNANGGVTYQWTPVVGLSNPNISNPKASPASTTDYKVVITDVDGCVDSAFVKVIVNTCTLACNNWLNTPTPNSNARVGDLDISGNQLTVEANFIRTAPVNPVGGYGFLVSKHTGPANVNYAMWPEGCAITTTDGEFFAQENCSFQLNRTYHVAMVYDGASLKYYRDGILHGQTPVSGNLIVNDLITTIGQNVPEGAPTVFPFIGYMNEVRIWNVARTQAQLQQYMYSSLPTPTTQTGLKGYYIFNDLLNKQGNPAFNVTLNGAAAINTTNPNCTFTPEIGTLANAGPDTTFCSNTTVTYTLRGTGNGTSYSWTPAIYLNNPNIQNPVATINATTTFYLTVNSPGACSSIDSVTIFVNALPTVKSINDTLICSTNPITLTTTGAQTYSWAPTIFLSNPNISNPVYSGNQSQAYIVTGTAANGCKAKDTVNVTVNVRGGLLAPPNKSMCGQSSVQLDGYNGNTVSYLWSPATYLSSTTIINPIANPPATTAYAVKISDAACNYDSTFIVQVLVGTSLAITVGKSNDIDCANRSATLFASGGDTYLWTPSTGLSNPNIPNPIATPGGTQKYIVFVSNASGCSNTDSVTVFANFAASLARYMPNAFTPNGDGLNDCYGLKNWMYIKNLEFRIFNRYGEQVFGTADPSRCWDGKYKGKIADQGSYVYYIKAETNCGTEEQKGSFLLMR